MVESEYLRRDSVALLAFSLTFVLLSASTIATEFFVSTPGSHQKTEALPAWATIPATLNNNIPCLFCGMPQKGANREKKKSNSYDQSVPARTQSGVKYGSHKRHIFDFWEAKSDTPTPAVLVIHGGGWRGGRKEDVHKFVDVKQLLDSGISVAAISYRLLSHAKDLKPPVKGPMFDSARALQFLRSDAKRLNIDPTRIGVTGGSAGACTSLWLAYHDDLADADNKDPVLRESSRPFCAAVSKPQTTLDPKLMREWIPNATYGAHAFGLDGKKFEAFLAQRDKYSDWIAEYSPYSLASKDDPPVYMLFTAGPAMGEATKDPTHSANFGIGLQSRCQELGIQCEVMYPGATGTEFKTTTEYLTAKLKADKAR